MVRPSHLLPPSSSLAAALPRRAFQWDLARQTERLDWLVAQLPRYAAWGYRELYLHLEDAVEYPSLPDVARPGAYSQRQLGRLVEAADRADIKVVPIVNLLGHTQYLLKVPGLRDLNERRAPDGSPLAQGQICPLHPRTLEVAGKLLRDVAPFCTAGKVHVGLDESYHLGEHPLSRAEIAAVGLAAHFARHVRRLHGLAGGLGLRLGLWADMLALLPAAIPLLPSGVIAYDWYYYPFRRRPRIELRNFAEYDLAAALRARGIEYWGCPMNGAFRHEPLPIFRERLANIAAWWRRCRRIGAAGLLITSWESNRLGAEMPLAVDAAAAGLWLEDEEDVGRLLAGGCRRLFGRRGTEVAKALRAADEHPFSGYIRWRINDRWDTVLTDEPLAPWRAEARTCARLARTRRLPSAVRASLRLRSYLAQRDLFVRAAGQGVWRIRESCARGEPLPARRRVRELERAAGEFARRLAAGKAAARALWRRTRDWRVAGPNERVLAMDAARLRSWRSWLRRCRDGSHSAGRSSPVAGAWQLIFTVENFAPASQKIVVERRTPAGGWEELFGLFTIEFQAAGAAPRAARVHRVSLPVDWAGPPAEIPALRLAVRGFGQLRVGGLLLTNGVDGFSIDPKAPRAALLGAKAARRGYPDFDWRRNRGTWTPKFAKTPCFSRGP